MKINECLNCLYTDTLMLDEGEWEPDHDSIEAHMEMIGRIAEELGITLVDTREEYPTYGD